MIAVLSKFRVFRMICVKGYGRLVIGLGFLTWRILGML